jgi:EAL domain-containing protein (putative c-di-GMP-specific phosphodiesterase class I)
LRNADLSMYEAKRRSDAIDVNDGPTEPRIAQPLRLVADFRAALESPRGGVTLHYQPQVRLGTCEIESFEALLRWNHPQHGPVPPSTVIRLIEETPTMRLLTARVVDEATAQLATWHHAGLARRMSINVSARDLYTDDLVHHLADRIAELGLPADLLQIEVTESALTSDPVRTRTTLRKIAALGVRISLDDFGTGYSSLQHLRRLPLSEIKIDQGFVAGMRQNPDDAIVVGSTITMAHALGLSTVAEGITDEATLKMLLDLGCDLGQGWHIDDAATKATTCDACDS